MKWTSDVREIERRMVRTGLIKTPLIWDAEDLKIDKPKLMNSIPAKRMKGRTQAGKRPVKNSPKQ